MITPPTEAFVPLTAAPAAAADTSDFRLLVVQQPEGLRPFRPQPAPAVPNPQPAPAPAGCEPRILVERDGDRVTSIHIQCSCGQSIDLACVYPPQAH